MESTIDLSKVAGFKAVDAEGNEMGVVSMNDLTAAISDQVLQTIAMRSQANTLEQPALMAASTLAAGNDAYENELQQVSDANWVRALLADGTPVLWNKSDMASVLGELMPMTIIKNRMIEIMVSCDCNLINKSNVIASNKWENPPHQVYINSYAILEVLSYNNGWFIQRFTTMSDNPLTYLRAFYQGNKWSNWREFKV